MISEADAQVGYDELLAKLLDIGAKELVREIEETVARGQVQDHNGFSTQAPLPSADALRVALDMLVAWLEPAVLVTESRRLLGAASGQNVARLVWAEDRVDVVGGVVLDAQPHRPPSHRAPIEEITQLDVEVVRKLSDGVKHLLRTARELEITEPTGGKSR